MIIKHTRDTLSETYLDAVAIRNTVFVKGQGVPRSIEIDANEAYCIHFVLYDDKGKAAATVHLSSTSIMAIKKSVTSLKKLVSNTLL